MARRSFQEDPGVLIITPTCYLSLTLLLHAEKEPQQRSISHRAHAKCFKSLCGDIKNTDEVVFRGGSLNS